MTLIDIIKKFVGDLRQRTSARQSRLFIGIAAFCTTIVIALVVKGSGQSESKTVFRREGPLDFKNASIIGNQNRMLAENEERRFSTNARQLQDEQKDIRNQLAAISAKLNGLSGPNTIESPNAQPSSSNLPQSTQSALPAAGLPFGPASDNTNAGGAADGNAIIRAGSSPSPCPTSSFTYSRQTETYGNTKRNQNRNPQSVWTMPAQTRSQKAGKEILAFPVKGLPSGAAKGSFVALPSGSYVKGKILTGVEAPEGRTYPALLQLDYATIIPNDKKIDLSGCFMIAKAQGDLSTERVQMQATKLSCVSKRGGFFEREINGFVADDVDNSFAVIGRVNSKQDRVAATAFLAGIVSGIGKAVQQAQTTSQATPLGGSQSIVTGDQAKYLGGGAASEAATMVTQWYLKQAQNLLPTINVGSGQDVWIVMQDMVELPKDYFRQNSVGGIGNGSIYSQFTKLID